MFKRVCSVIERKRYSSKLIWKLSVLTKDFVWKYQIRLKKTGKRIYHFFPNRHVFQKLIKNQRILIIGSGSSAKDLQQVPSDVRILTCNLGLKLLVDNRFSDEPDLFLCYKFAFEHYKIKNLLSKIKTKIFVFDDIIYVKRRNGLGGAYHRLICDDCENNYYLKKLIQPYTVKDIKGESACDWTSTGIRLLQYALYFQAKEIYLIGIDFGKKGYFWGEQKEKSDWRHTDIDENFIRLVSKRNQNLYSASPNSPILQYIRYKPLRY